MKRLEGRKFVLLGINSDKAGRMKAAIEKQKMTWPNWADGSTDGKIAGEWGVVSWPTIYVLDAQGVIRFKHVHDDADLDKEVDSLLDELSKTEKK